MGTPTRVDTRKYTDKMLATRDKTGEFGDGEDGISFHCNNDPERCRKNIFSIIQNGNFDLVGMQEYVHDKYSIGKENEIIEHVYSKKEYIPSLGNMKLVLGHVPLNMTKWVNGVQTKTGDVKRVEIGSLYNKNKFEQVGNHHYFDLGPDGRPVLIVLLKEKSSDSHILFINAHMPQGYNIKGKGKPDEIIANKIDREIKKKNDKTREERRIRYGDIILDSLAIENSFKYDYPVEIEGEPYSDHAPISAILPPTIPPAPVSQGPKPPLPPQEKNEDNATSSGLFSGWWGGKKKRRKRKRTRKKKKRSRRKKRGGKKSRKKKRKRKTRRKRKN